MHKIFKILAFVIGIVAVLLFVLMLVKGNDAIVATGEGVDGPLYWGYLTIGLTTLIVLFFALKGIFAGNLKKTLIVLGSFVAIIVIAYAMGSGEIPAGTQLDAPVSESAAKWVDAGLYAFYIIAALAIIVTAFGGIKRLTK